MGLSYMDKDVPHATSKKQNGDTYNENTGDDGTYKNDRSK